MKIFAHRGASGHAPENTMEAFVLAYEMGADGIELDVQMTADGELVVIHDEDIKRTSNGEGLVMQKTYEELSGYDYGSWFSDKFKGAKIPTLKQVLDWIKPTGMELNVEIKTMPAWYDKKLTEAVLAAVEAADMVDRVIISSFDHQAIADTRSLSDCIRCAPLYMASFLAMDDYCKKQQFNCVHPLFHCVTPALVQACHKVGVEVNTWTVNQKEDAEKMRTLGVDTIITNYPEILA